MAGGSCDLLIFDSRLLWQTVSNAADKSTATQIVRSGGFLWLNLIAMSGAGWIYLLIVGRIRDSSTFVAWQRSEIGQYRVPREVSLPGFGIGMIIEDFHIAGLLLFTP